jgi:UDP-N-acetylmuramoyl-L-alanyl-D-glutamate--2,6-diaminopimelate ligase
MGPMLESRPPSVPVTGDDRGVPAPVPLSTSPSDLTQAPPDTGRPLGDLVRSLGERSIVGHAGVGVTAVTYRSDEASPGSLFFCVPGGSADGHDFAEAAVRSGAVALVVERRLPVPVTQVVVPSVREAMGPISAEFYGRPSERLAMVGVTGTNGKTTTTYLLESIFRAAGLAPGVIGTTGIRVAGTPEPFPRTTPEAPDLHRLLAGMVEGGVRAVAMEVSSHGLHQHRVGGIRFECAVFTNLTQDHLDYHGTLEEYFRAKAMLFDPAISERAAVNWDSPEGRRLLRDDLPTLTYGLGEGADLLARDVATDLHGVSFRVQDLPVRSRLRGTFNVYNCLAALAAARQLGLSDAVAADGIGDLAGVPGRLEPVEEGQDFLVVVDYAHTPDSLENVLRAARELCDGNVIVAFGCGGDRDRGKRPVMGEVATRLANLSIITSDNPRSEDPIAIVREIEAGARGGGAHVVEPDRRAAIRAAVRKAQAGDVVVIAGKGHETGQEFADRTVPFDDRQVAAQELRAVLEEVGP